MSALHLTKTDFDEKVKNGVAMVDFWAVWCGPCKVAGPIIDQLSEDYEGKALVAKVDVDAEQELAQRYGVMSIPTVVLLKDGKELGRQVGFSGKNSYVELLKKAGL